MNRTHRVLIFRRASAPAQLQPAPRSGLYPPTAEQEAAGGGWEQVGEGVEVSLYPVSGGLVPTGAGVEVVAKVDGFAPSGTDVRAADGLLVVAELEPGAGLGGARLIAHRADPQGAAWDIELELLRTEVLFG